MLKRFSVYAVLIPGLILSLNSCFYDGPSPLNKIEGHGPIVSQELELSRIRGIVIRNSAEVRLTQGDQQNLVVEAQQNIIDNLKTEVSDGILYLGNKKMVWRTKPIQVRLRISDLRVVKVSGSGDISSDNTFSGIDRLEVNISGSGDIDLAVEADEITAHIGGSGNISLKGDCREGEFVINGSGSILAAELETNRAYARISGSGGIHLNVEDKLEARISGSGDILYNGRPDVDSHISGSGHVRKR